MLSQFIASPISFVFSHFAVSFTGMIRLITYLLHSQTHIFHIMYVEAINVFQNRFRVVFFNICLYDYLYFRKLFDSFFIYKTLGNITISFVARELAKWSPSDKSFNKICLDLSRQKRNENCDALQKEFISLPTPSGLTQKLHKEEVQIC